MPTVVEAKFGRQPCADLSKVLREMANAVDRGEIIELVSAHIQNGEFVFFSASSPETSLTLATLLHQKSIDRFRA